MTPQLEQLILGSLFGDASLSKPRTTGQNAYLEESHSIAQRGYLLWKKEIFEKHGIKCSYAERDIFHKPSGKILRRCTIATESLPVFKDLRVQFYLEDRKQVQRRFLNRLDEFGISIWYMDDGHLSVYVKETGAQHRNAYLHTEDFGVEGNEIIRKWCENVWQISPRLWKDNKGYHLLRYPSLEFQKLLPLITPYIHPTLTYKVDMKFKRPRAVIQHNAKYSELVQNNDIV